MIKFGESQIIFSFVAHNGYDITFNVIVKTSSCEFDTRIHCHKGNLPFGELLQLNDLPEFSWKSDCENLIMKKHEENGQTAIDVDLCIDAEEIDEFWNLKICSRFDGQVKVNSEEVKALVKQCT